MKSSLTTRVMLLGVMLLTFNLQAQVEIGFNMPNATSSILTLSDSTYLLELIPEGDSLSFRYRYDKDDMGKPVSNTDFIALYKWLEKKDRHLSVIFTAGDGNNSETFDALSELKANAIKPTVIEFVNEAFYTSGGYSFNWSLYEPVLKTFIEGSKQIFPDVSVSIPLAPRSTDSGIKGATKSHKTWNDAAFTFVNTNPQYSLAVSVHIYYNGNEIAAIGSVTTDEVGTNEKGTYPVKRVYNYQTDVADKEYFSNIYSQADPLELWEYELSYINSRTMVPVYVTEIGIAGTGLLNGSYVYAAKVFEALCMYGFDSRIKSINVNAGIGKSRTSAVAKRETFDVRDLDNKNNVSTPTWDAVTLYKRLQNLGGVYEYEDGVFLDKEGTYTFWYLNNGTSKIPTAKTSSDLTVSDYSVYSINATRIDAIATSMAHTSKGSVIGINEVTKIVQGDEISDVSFGYITFTVERIVVEPVCMKKRWLFSGCKTAKRNCNCN
jgi:hypothetical protein